MLKVADCCQDIQIGVLSFVCEFFAEVSNHHPEYVTTTQVFIMRFGIDR
jgi:hypothetical protein